MKKNYPFGIVPLMLAIILMACSSDDGKNEPDVPSGNVTVTATPDVLSAGPDATTLQLKVEADADWAIDCNADWATVRPSGGVKNTPVTVQVSVKANSTMEQRSADLRITSRGNIIKTVTLSQGYVESASSSVRSVVMSGAESSASMTVTANTDWRLECKADWLTLTPSEGTKGETLVTLKANENKSAADREAAIALVYGDKSEEIKVTQMSDAINIPDGYSLVWADEFNGGPSLGSDWVAENWPAGYVNHELQIYTSKPVDGKATLEVKDGFLNINCFKASDGKVYSGRVNARPSTGWLYGYFEARINLPSGKGTWPAYWMMPCNVDWSTNGWPRCGEIDIMEEVGANPDYVSSSLHTENYNHTKGTQKTHEMYCAGAEGSFHIYALEWTEDEIITYVDGKVQLRATRASMGADHASWPFHYAFYPILNLAWGGDWGGYKGVDDSALPVTMKIDYVRIFQKNR